MADFRIPQPDQNFQILGGIPVDFENLQSKEKKRKDNACTICTGVNVSPLALY